MNDRLRPPMIRIAREYLSHLSLPMCRDAQALALQYEDMRDFGRRLLLSDAEVSEVFLAWQEAYSHTPWPLNWERVKLSLSMRADGEEWRP